MLTESNCTCMNIYYYYNPELYMELEVQNFAKIILSFWICLRYKKNKENISFYRKRDLGGSSVLDLGVYTLQLALLLFGNKPNTIKAAGHLNSEGIDESMSCVLTYPGGKTACLSTHGVIDLPNTALIIGSKGKIEVI